jgi:hypothetical protein
LFKHNHFGKPPRAFPDQALVPSNKAASAESACSRIDPAPPEGTGMRPSDEPASSEIHLLYNGLIGKCGGLSGDGSFRLILSTQIIQQRINPGMIAL